MAARRPGVDDCLVGMLMLDMDHLACDASCLCSAGDGAESLLASILLHAMSAPVIAMPVRPVIAVVPVPHPNETRGLHFKDT